MVEAGKNVRDVQKKLPLTIVQQARTEIISQFVYLGMLPLSFKST